MISNLAYFLRVGVFSLLLLHFCQQPALAADPPGQKAVLVTGASTGIGRNIAERLAAEGFFVYAGARKDTDIEALSAIDNIQGLRLDVTIQADIDAAVRAVEVDEARVGRGSPPDHVDAPSPAVFISGLNPLRFIAPDLPPDTSGLIGHDRRTSHLR